MQTLFITGTGTDVGKTVVCGALGLALMQNGKKVAYWKPVQTGAGPDAGDVKKMRDWAGENLLWFPPLYEFILPASPNQAAKFENRDGVKIDALLTKTAEWLVTLKHDGVDFLIIEGAGGLYVPLNESFETWFDYLTRTNLAVFVVAPSGLGTLNHSSLTLSECRRRAIDVRGLILSGDFHEGNHLDLKSMWPNIPVFDLPRLDTSSASKDLASFVEQNLTPADIPDVAGDDKKFVWHPYTQHQIAGEPLIIERAKGVWLHTKEGKKVLDGTSSWWVNTIGHGRLEIQEAIARQQKQLDHVIFAGVSHKPAATLAKKIIELNGGRFAKVFFSDNGSTAVEVALKIAYQRHINRGEYGRRKFLALTGSYHGDTFGCMSVARENTLHNSFKDLLFDCEFVKPATRPSDVEQSLAAAKNLLEVKHHEMAAVIIEPLVQGAAGMLMHSEVWLREFVKLCRSFDLTVIFDEVFTGFGRVGETFAWQRVGVEPDIICLAKALTGGNLPLALTVTSQTYFEAFLSDDKKQALLHGHSYTANAIACAAALSAVEIMQSEDLPGKARWLENEFANWIESEGKRLGIVNPRCLGGILAFELPGSDVAGYFYHSGDICERALRHGLMIRPLGNTFYFMPPLVIDAAELQFALNAIQHVLKRSDG